MKSNPCVVGIDPHRNTFTATMLDQRGAVLDSAHFSNTRVGFEELSSWAADRGRIMRWGIEGAGGLGRHLAEFLVKAGHDVRDVPPHRTAQRQRGRHQGKSDVLDSHRIAAETQTNPRLSAAFKRSGPGGPDPIREQLALWHNARRSLCKIWVQLLGEIDALVYDLPEELRARLQPAKTIRARVNSLAALDGIEVSDPVVKLRLELIAHRVAMLRDVLAQDKKATAELTALINTTGSTLTNIVGIAPRAAAELLVEVGDIHRFSAAGFARFNGTAPIPASSSEGDNQTTRHRLSRGGNRRVNATIHRVAMIQLRYEPAPANSTTVPANEVTPAEKPPAS